MEYMGYAAVTCASFSVEEMWLIARAAQVPYAGIAVANFSFDHKVRPSQM